MEKLRKQEMDIQERLEKAQATKQKGTEFFKRGLIEEAQNHYNKVLEHVKIEAPVPGNMREKLEALVLAAHLNLALCQLRLDSDVTKVIEHCNQALEIDRNNVKAYYRRGQAHQRSRDYELALKDFHKVLSIEPHNTAAKQEMDICLKKREDTTKYRELCTPASSTKTLLHDQFNENASDDICFETTLAFESEENESDYDEIYLEYEGDTQNELPTKCPKVSTHDQFILFQNLTIEHLPISYREDAGLFKLILLQGQLAVLLKIKGTSKNRPKTYPESGKEYPFSDPKSRNKTRVGSGWVSGVESHTGEENRDCYCSECKKTGKPTKDWGEILVTTGAHVVVDEIEGKNTTCYLSFDSDEVGLIGCPSLKAAVEVKSDIVEDVSYVTFITHDMRLAEMLYTMIESYSWQINLVRYKYIYSDENGEPDYVKMMELYDRLSRAVGLFGELIDTFKTHLAEVTPEWWNNYMAWLINNGYPDGDELAVVLIKKLDGIESGEDILNTMNEKYEIYLFYLEQLTIVKESDPSVLENDQKMAKFLELYKVFFERVDAVERELDTYRSLICDKRKLGSDLKLYTKKASYDARHPLTVIISHPHGRSKRVSIGEVVNRTVATNDIKAGYLYTNVTCRGSSGARVFILGKKRVMIDHPHMKSVAKRGLNQSALSADF